MSTCNKFLNSHTYTQLRREGRVSSVADVVSRGQEVKVKVLTFTGNKTSLSMKDVDQVTGEDLNPSSKVMTSQQNDNADLRNPDRPSFVSLIQGANKEVDNNTNNSIINKCSYYYYFSNIF